jgi:hypothetical protein
VHRSFEDIEFVKAAAGQGDVAAVAKRMERLAVD